jgi:Mor family transcriptional regulator
MGASPEPKTERNREMYNRWRNGEDVYDLIREYEISLARFYVIKKKVENSLIKLVEAELPIDN